MVRFDPGHISLLIDSRSQRHKINEHRRGNEPSKSSVVSGSIVKTALEIVIQGYVVFSGGFKIETDGDRCG
jgi:hypothetical protein